MGQVMDGQLTHVPAGEDRPVWLAPLEAGDGGAALDLTRNDHRQYLFVHSGGGSAELDGWQTLLYPGDILFIPTRTIAHLWLAPETRCYRFGITDSFLISRVSPTLAIPFATHAAGFNTPRKLRLWTAASESTDRDRLWTELSLARRRLGPTGDVAVAAYVMLVLFEKNNNPPSGGPLPTNSFMGDGGETPDPAVALVIAFRGLIEQRMTDHLRVQDYAVALGVNGLALMKACKRVFATTPSALIRDRLLRDAKRRLVYSRASAARIADELGFSDAAYFSRFFKRETGQSPLEFRRRGAGSPRGSNPFRESRSPSPGTETP
jgi:AraC family transcriptional activator of pobA